MTLIYKTSLFNMKHNLFYVCICFTRLCTRTYITLIFKLLKETNFRVHTLDCLKQFNYVTCLFLSGNTYNIKTRVNKKRLKIQSIPFRRQAQEFQYFITEIHCTNFIRINRKINAKLCQIQTWRNYIKNGQICHLIIERNQVLC